MCVRRERKKTFLVGQVLTPFLFSNDENAYLTSYIRQDIQPVFFTFSYVSAFFPFF